MLQSCTWVSVGVGILSVGKAYTIAVNQGNWCGTPISDARTALESLALFALPLGVVYLVQAIKGKMATLDRCILLMGVVAWTFCTLFAWFA